MIFTVESGTRVEPISDENTVHYKMEICDVIDETGVSSTTYPEFTYNFPEIKKSRKERRQEKSKKFNKKKRI